MHQYKKQVDKEHYHSTYDSLERFVSYYNQKKLVLEAIEKIDSHKSNIKILEIGRGTGFLSSYLKSFDLNIKTLDIAADLKPDYVGNLLNAESLPKEKFEIVCCFEVLEHIKFEDIGKALENLKRLNDGYVIISVPQIRLYSSIWIKLPLLKSKGFSISLPFPLQHIFDGEHYWELGKKNYDRKKFKKLLQELFYIIDGFTHPLDPYHRFFVLTSK